MAKPAVRTLAQPAATAYVAHCLELLGPIGPVRGRRMFGGWGLYAQDLFVAVIADDRLYLKVDELTEPAFVAAGGERFEFVSATRTVAMRYWTPPAEAMDSPALMAPWAQRALAAAIRARSTSPAAPVRSPSRRASRPR